MEIQFLGTGSGVPAKQRNVSSIALKLLDERNTIWLFDCGEGTQMQILHTTIKPRKIEKIFITHLHGDHIFGLPGLLSSRSFQGGTEPIEIIGPKGIKEYVQTSLRLTGTHLTYPLQFQELTAGGVVVDDATFKVTAAPLDHGIKCFGYRMEEASHVGELQVEKLRAEKIPAGPIYGQLKAGKTVNLPDGRQIFGADYIGKDRPGRIVTILGDTRISQNGEQLAVGADLLVHESTFAFGQEKMARAYFHSTNVQAAQMAKRVGVKKLLLTHISARFLAKDALLLQSQAQEIFPDTTVVKDFDQFEIPMKE
ncbi:ribonuclease Z [Enterococcus timonensis]|uniref:ribonuclease Z n=1 Tax=Enterococcus timonensis TaxID=1852364 RepID=UPI0008D9080D|nr:ribonuclease Z [Enterococcus timonensis]